MMMGSRISSISFDGGSFAGLSTYSTVAVGARTS